MATSVGKRIVLRMHTSGALGPRWGSLRSPDRKKEWGIAISALLELQDMVVGGGAPVSRETIRGHAGASWTAIRALVTSTVVSSVSLGFAVSQDTESSIARSVVCPSQ